ncbi:MAG: hypothetical protein H6719_05195 [Sandaracinaceae bacterium]|nr:hypothetical protein [Sandaracinaceae bacterium]
MKVTTWAVGCALWLAACGGDVGSGADAGPLLVDAGGGLDAGVGMDAASMTLDAGHDAGEDAGVPATDAGFDAGPPRPMTDGGIMVACTLDEIAPIFECARMACVSLPDASLPGLPDGGFDLEAGLPDASFSLPDASLPDPAELATCILSRCWREVFGVSDACRGCLLAGVGMDLMEIQMRCVSGLPTP